MWVLTFVSRNVKSCRWRSSCLITAFSCVMTTWSWWEHLRVHSRTVSIAPFMSSLLNIFKGSVAVLQFRLNSQELFLAVLSVFPFFLLKILCLLESRPFTTLKKWDFKALHFYRQMMPGNNDLIWGYFPLAIAAFSIPSSGDLCWYQPSLMGKWEAIWRKASEYPYRRKGFLTYGSRGLQCIIVAAGVCGWPSSQQVARY